MTEKTGEHGYQGRVSVDHIASLSQVPDRLAHRTIDLVKEAKLNVIVLPTRMRLTRVLELLEAGVNVAIGTDNQEDVFSHIGLAGDMLGAMLLLAQLLNLGHDEELVSIFQMGTYNAAKAMRLQDGYGAAEGNTVDLVVLEAGSVAEAIQYQARKKAVIKKGRMVVTDGRICTN